MSQFNRGTAVKWKWGNGTAEGKIKRVFKSRVSRTIKGKKITRNATENSPAYLVEQDDGSRALKSERELSAA